jgi:hypothetical protein
MRRVLSPNAVLRVWGIIARSSQNKLECPLFVYTDLDTSLCKTIEESQLTRVEPVSRTLGPSVGRHPPHGMHDLESPEHQLDDLERAVLLPPLLGHRGDPAPRRVIDTRIGHQQLVGLLDPQRFIIDQEHAARRAPPAEVQRMSRIRREWHCSRT